MANNGNSREISYEFTFPLDNELQYFINHLDSNSILKANGDSAIEVMRILTDASNKIME